MNESFFKRVYALVKQVPKGKVVTYGQVAALLGNPRMSRQVGYALHVNPEPGDVIPCHRVIDRFGSLTRGFAFGGIEVQAAMLSAEGIEVSETFTVDLEKYRWDGQGAVLAQE